MRMRNDNDRRHNSERKGESDAGLRSLNEKHSGKHS